MRYPVLLLALAFFGCGPNTLVESEDFVEGNISVVSVDSVTETILNPDSVMKSYTVAMEGESEAFDFAVFAINQFFKQPLLSQSPFEEADIKITFDEDIGHTGVAYVHRGAYCDIVLRSRAQKDWKIYGHELLHCLGFGHSDSTKSIMYPKAVGGEFTTAMLPLWEKALKNNKFNKALAREEMAKSLGNSILIHQ